MAASSSQEARDTPPTAAWLRFDMHDPKAFPRLRCDRRILEGSNTVAFVDVAMAQLEHKQRDEVNEVGTFVIRCVDAHRQPATGVKDLRVFHAALVASKLPRHTHSFKEQGYKRDRHALTVAPSKGGRQSRSFDLPPADVFELSSDDRDEYELGRNFGRRLVSELMSDPPHEDLHYGIGGFVAPPTAATPLSLAINSGYEMDRLGYPEVAGVSSVYMYVSPRRGTGSPWHREDGNLGSLNELLCGAPKVWISVGSAHMSKFETAVRKDFPAVKHKCDQFIRHAGVFLSHEWLRKHGIPFRVITQLPGDIVVTLPDTYHMVVNQGANIAAAVNIDLSHPPTRPLNPSYIYCQPGCGISDSDSDVVFDKKTAKTLSACRSKAGLTAEVRWVKSRPKKRSFEDVLTPEQLLVLQRLGGIGRVFELAGKVVQAEPAGVQGGLPPSPATTPALGRSNLNPVGTESVEVGGAAPGGATVDYSIDAVVEVGGQALGGSTVGSSNDTIVAGDGAAIGGAPVALGGNGGPESMEVYGPTLGGATVGSGTDAVVEVGGAAGGGAPVGSSNDAVVEVGGAAIGGAPVASGESNHTPANPESASPSLCPRVTRSQTGAGKVTTSTKQVDSGGEDDDESDSVDSSNKKTTRRRKAGPLTSAKPSKKPKLEAPPLPFAFARDRLISLIRAYQNDYIHSPPRRLRETMALAHGTATGALVAHRLVYADDATELANLRARLLKLHLLVLYNEFVDQVRAERGLKKGKGVPKGCVDQFVESLKLNDLRGGKYEKQKVEQWLSEGRKYHGMAKGQRRFRAVLALVPTSCERAVVLSEVREWVESWESAEGMGSLLKLAACFVRAWEARKPFLFDVAKALKTGDFSYDDGHVEDGDDEDGEDRNGENGENRDGEDGEDGEGGEGGEDEDRGNKARRGRDEQADEQADDLFVE